MENSVTNKGEGNSVVGEQYQSQTQNMVSVEVQRHQGWGASSEGGWIVFGMMLACLIAAVSFRIGRAMR